MCRRWRPVCVLSCLCYNTLAHRYQAPNTHCIALQAPARLANKPTQELPEISTAIQVRKHCLSNCMCNLFCVSADGAVDAMAASSTNYPSEGASLGCLVVCVTSFVSRQMGQSMWWRRAAPTNQVREHSFGCLVICVTSFVSRQTWQLVQWCTGSLLVSAAPARLDSNANNLVSIMHINYYKFVPILSDIAVSRINDPLQFGWLWSVSCLCRR